MKLMLTIRPTVICPKENVAVISQNMKEYYEGQNMESDFIFLSL